MTSDNAKKGHTVRFRPHCPGFINDGQPFEGPCEFTGIEGLGRIPRVARFLDAGAELSLDATYSMLGTETAEHLLIGTYEGGASLVVGYLSPTRNAECLGLPAATTRTAEEDRLLAKKRKAENDTLTGQLHRLGVALRSLRDAIISELARGLRAMRIIK